MGVDTKVILTKGTTIINIADALKLKYSNVEIFANKNDFMYIVFTDNTDIRTMYVSFSNYCLNDYGIAGVWVSLGYWGNSIDIMKYLCETFGGYLDENDCDANGFYPINSELYLKGEDLTERDLFVNDIIAELGYEKLSKSLKIFDKYIK